MFVATTFVLTACGKKAPELSFEETLKVYSQNNLAVRELISFFSTTGYQVASDFDLNVKVDAKEQMKGSFAIKSSSVNDNTTRDNKSTLDISMDLANQGEEESPSTIKGNLNLSVLLTSFQPFFRLNTFNLETEPKEIAGMAMGFSEMFKEKWLTFQNPEFIELLKLSAKTDSSFWLDEKLYEANSSYYTGATLTTYEGNPAWKVDFNMEEIKKVALEIYDANQAQTVGLFTGEEALAQQETMRAAFVDQLENLQFENVDAYFVIRSADKVDFIIKNADLMISDLQMHIEQTLDGKVLTTTVTVKKEEKEISKAVFVLDPQGKGKYAFTLRVAQIEEDASEKELFSLSGKLHVNLSEKKVAIIPSIELAADKLNLKIDAKLESKKTSGTEFKAPDAAQDIQEMLAAFGGLGAQPVGLEEELTGEVVEPVLE